MAIEYYKYQNVTLYGSAGGQGGSLNTVVATNDILVPFSETGHTVYNNYRQYTENNPLIVGSYTVTPLLGPKVTLDPIFFRILNEAGIYHLDWIPVLMLEYGAITNIHYFEDLADSLTEYFKKPLNYMEREERSHYELSFPGQSGRKDPITIPSVYANATSIGNIGQITITVQVYDTTNSRWYCITALTRGSGWESTNKSRKFILTVSERNPTSDSDLRLQPSSIIVTPSSPSNPYPNIPDSAPGGGNGPGIGGSDSNPVPPLPSISAVGTGMCRLYNPTVSQLIDLGAWLWGSGLDLTQLKKIFQDPMDIILGCSIFPVAMPGDTTEHIMFGNLDSEVSAKVVSSQYTTRDLGTIQIPETYNSYLDYSPYTKIQLYLPYIGMKQLNTDEVMGKTLGVVYSIDLLSGACVAHVYVESQLMYEFGGTCNTQIPLTARDYTATVQSLVGIIAGAAMAGFAVATLPESVPLGVGATGAVGAMVGNSVKNTISAKPTVEHASAIGGSTGIMASQHAYVIMEVPNLCHPPNQEHFTGYPGFIYGKVSDFEGYTKFVNFEFINIHATEPELQELQDWFMNKGVRI